MFNQKENILIDLLRQVKEVLDERNIEFWLDSGTLLGAVRNGKFIPWDHDIDLGSWHKFGSDNMKTSVARELCNRGFKVCVTENNITISKDEYWADIFFNHLVNDKAIKPYLIPRNLIGRFLSIFIRVLSAPCFYNIEFRRKPKRLIRSILIIVSRILPCLLRKQIAKLLKILHKKFGSKDLWRVVPSHYFLNLSIIKFYGMEFRVPHEAEKFLAWKYGKDWRIAKKDWTTDEDGAFIKS